MTRWSLLLALLLATACAREAQDDRRRDTHDPDTATADGRADGAGDATPESDQSEPDQVPLDVPADLPPDLDVGPDVVTPAAVELLAEASLADKTTLKAMFDVLDHATTTLDIAHFEANDDPIVDALLNSLKKAKARGVKVRVMLDDDVAENQLAIDTLQAEGIDARLDNATRTLHDKLIIADEAVTLFGSTNWSETSLKYSHEANLLLRDDQIGQKASEYFQALWDNPQDLKQLPRVTTPHAVVAFDRDTVDLLREQIRAASSRVQLVYYDISLQTDEIRAIADEVVAARQRGAQVTVILEYNDWDDIVNDINADAAAWLQGKGIQVLADPIDEQTHAKLAICDDVVVVSSGNLSYESLYKDHEIAATSADPNVLADALAWFQAMKAMSTIY